MDLAVLLHMSGIINHYSTRYEARVPKEPVPYVRLIAHELVTRKCNALVVSIRRKNKNPIFKTQWTIYETDIEKIARRISRRDAEFATRIKDITLTSHDVELMVRRATYQRLKLQLSSSPVCEDEKT